MPPHWVCSQTVGSRAPSQPPSVQIAGTGAEPHRSTDRAEGTRARRSGTSTARYGSASQARGSCEGELTDARRSVRARPEEVVQFSTINEVASALIVAKLHPLPTSANLVGSPDDPRVRARGGRVDEEELATTRLDPGGGRRPPPASNP